MAELNIKMQTRNQNVYQIYQEVTTFTKQLVTPVLIDTRLDGDALIDEENLKPIDEVEFPGKNFNDFLQECEDEASLTLRD